MRMVITSGYVADHGRTVYTAELHPEDEEEKTLLGSLMGSSPLHVRTLELDKIGEEPGLAGKVKVEAKAQVRKGTAE